MEYIIYQNTNTESTPIAEFDDITFARKFIHWCTNGKKGPMPKLQINPKYKSMFSHHLKEEAFILNTDITDKDLND